MGSDLGFNGGGWPIWVVVGLVIFGLRSGFRWLRSGLVVFGLLAVCTGVMVMELVKWREGNYRTRIENWMEVQRKKRIYELGSLPPFLLVFAGWKCRERKGSTNWMEVDSFILCT